MAEFFVVIAAAIGYVKQAIDVAQAGSFAMRVARKAWELWQGQKGNQASQAAVQALREVAAAEPADVARQAQAAVQQAAPQATPQEQRIVLDYLTQIAGRTRATFSRSADPTGRTAPEGLIIHSGEDFAPFLPPRLSPLQPGMRPSGTERWELVERLGCGGFGEVWKARHLQLANTFSVFKFCLDEQAQKLLQHESHIIELVRYHLANLPHVVQLIDADLHADQPWVQYEFVDGVELHRWAAQWPNDPAARLHRTLEALTTLAQTLASCHKGFDIEAGRRIRIIHRDLKPANILVSRQEVLKIADFGISLVQALRQAAENETWTEYTRLAGQSAFMRAFSPLYASPEQRRGEEPHPSDDVYALGVIAYQLLLGDYWAQPGPELVDELKQKQVPDQWCEVFRRCVASRRERRYPDAGELLKGLEKAERRTAATRSAAAVDSSRASTADARPSSRRIEPTDDLAAAVAAASPGTILELMEGTFFLKSTLRIDRPLVLKSLRGNAVIVSPAEGAVLEFQSPGRLMLENLTIRHIGTQWANVVVVRDGEIRIQNCQFTGGVWDRQNRRGGSGLWLTENTCGLVQNCVMEENELSGIYVDEQAKPLLVNNQCTNNKVCGIAYFGSAAGAAQNNSCSHNEQHGIYVDQQAKPQLLNNQCSNNKGCGIAYYDSAAGTAQNNSCSHNEQHGIQVNNQAQPQLVNNQCSNNKWSGIAYAGSAAGTAQNNSCSGNEKNGIYVGQQAKPQLLNNQCSNNKWSGIAYFGSAAGTAQNNSCSHNEQHGIVVGQQAKPQLLSNQCSNNKVCGIAYFGSAAGTVQNNSCSHNEQHGIEVSKCDQPQLVNNQCSNNKVSDFFKPSYCFNYLSILFGLACLLLGLLIYFHGGNVESSIGSIAMGLFLLGMGLIEIAPWAECLILVIGLVSGLVSLLWSVACR